MEIKIVGAIPDENTLDEISSIAKIFVYEQRMKKFTNQIKNDTPIIKKSSVNQKKNEIPQRLFTNYIPYVKIKGLV